jgi:5-oxoprolinase (ATP-hydrolysing) subunit A
MPNQRSVNLNADLGESFGAWRMGNDDAMLTVVKSANIACGFHAGDPTVMRHTLALARTHGVSIGARCVPSTHS